MELDPKGRCATCAPCVPCPDCGHSYQPVDGPCPCHAEAAERTASRGPDLAAVRGQLATALHPATTAGYLFAARCAHLTESLGDDGEPQRLASLERSRAELARSLAALDTALAALRTATAHDPSTWGRS